MKGNRETVCGSDLNSLMEGPPAEKPALVWGVGLYKRLPQHLLCASSFRVRHLRSPKTLGTRSLEKVGCVHRGILRKGQGCTQRDSRCPVLGVRSQARKGAGAAGGQRGGGARRRRPAPSPPLGFAPLLFPRRSGIRAHPAEARLLLGEAPAGRCAGPPTKQ